MGGREPKKHLAIKQSRDKRLLTDATLDNKVVVSKKVRLSVLAEQDFNQELKEFLTNDNYTNSNLGKNP